MSTLTYICIYLLFFQEYIPIFFFRKYIFLHGIHVFVSNEDSSLFIHNDAQRPGRWLVKLFMESIIGWRQLGHLEVFRIVMNIMVWLCVNRDWLNVSRLPDFTLGSVGCIVIHIHAAHFRIYQKLTFASEGLMLCLAFHLFLLLFLSPTS